MGTGVLQDRHTAAAAVVDVCHRLYAGGFVTATDGNVSVRLPGGGMLTTRTGVNKGAVTPRDLVELTPEGTPLVGHGTPSTEIGMHLFIYRERPDCNAVVHAHPVYATGFATARIPLEGCLFPEVIVGLGTIPLAEYATPSTAEVAASLAPYVKSADAILLANHGVVTYGADPLSTYFKMEKVEHAARITFVARMLGGEHLLTSDEVAKLREVSVQSYGKDISGNLACAVEGPDGEMTEREVRRYIEQKLASLGIVP
jgi:L-fuculose-phosphate aldolase